MVGINAQDRIEFLCQHAIDHSGNIPSNPVQGLKFFLDSPRRDVLVLPVGTRSDRSRLRAGTGADAERDPGLARYAAS